MFVCCACAHSTSGAQADWPHPVTAIFPHPKSAPVQNSLPVSVDPDQPRLPSSWPRAGGADQTPAASGALRLSLEVPRMFVHQKLKRNTQGTAPNDGTLNISAVIATWGPQGGILLLPLAQPLRVSEGFPPTRTQGGTLSFPWDGAS